MYLPGHVAPITYHGRVVPGDEVSPNSADAMRRIAKKKIGKYYEPFIRGRAHGREDK